ncbi:T6SS immunity protein Tdi1 domain-containing protein [Demequina sp.]|uniref:T6SS immunity protein Tdi1 domain-containing protein n=1 Tax=Demequina sp. TaxID=2050685 RepID=UPI003D125ADD
MELIRRFAPEQYVAALEQWEWAGISSLTPVFTSPFGDVFFSDADGAYWYLDTVAGQLTREWDSGAELQAAVNTRDGQDQFLMVALAEAASANGIEPDQDQVLSFVVPPVLGGQLDPANLGASDFVVTLDLLGQIHRQVKDLPPGTQISGVNLG